MATELDLFLHQISNNEGEKLNLDVLPAHKIIGAISLDH